MKLAERGSNFIRQFGGPGEDSQIRALWKALGMKFDGCHCQLGRNDGIAKERYAEMKEARTTAPLIGPRKPLPVLA